MVRTACQQASGWGAFGVDRYMHLLKSMVLVCLVNDTQARGALGPRLETITRLGLTVAFIIGLHGHGPMVCLELSALGMSRFHNDKMAELSRLLDYEFPVGHSEYACKLHKMSEVPSVIGAEHNGHPWCFLWPCTDYCLDWRGCPATRRTTSCNTGCTGAWAAPLSLCL